MRRTRIGGVLVAWLVGWTQGAGADAGGSPGAPLTNSLGMEFVLVPGGAFEMGGSETAASFARDFAGYPPGRFEELADELPRHRVRITRPFYLGRHEVTLGQFRRFVAAAGHVPESVADGTGGYGFRRDYDPATTARRDNFEGRDPKYSWQNPGFAQGEDHPVVNVTWNDAQALAAWLSKQEGRRYRLPTEAEWEYACRAGTTTRYHNGDALAGLTAVGNVFDLRTALEWPAWTGVALQADDGHTFTAPVGRYQPNAWGLYDMHGNVWEWTADWYGEDYYARSPGDDPQGPADGNVKVRRGGSWHTWPAYVRCAYRNWNTVQTRYTLVGIRLVLEAEPAFSAPPTAPSPSAR